MKKFYIFLFCCLITIGLGIGSCGENTPEPDPCETNPQPGCPNYVDPCEANPQPGCPNYVDPCEIDPQPGCPNYVDPCETNPQPGCPNYVDPEAPALAGTITLGTVTYTVDSTYREKLEDGFWYVYLQLKNAEKPLIIHSVRYATGTAGYSIETWIGEDLVTGKETPSAMVNRYDQAGRKVRVAINGGFYGTEVGGTAMGLEVMNGFISFPPAPDQPVIGFDAQNRPYMGYAALNAKVKGADNNELDITTVNGTRYADYLVLYNSFKGSSTNTNPWGTEALCAPVTGQWESLDSYVNVPCKVEKMEYQDGSKGNMEIPKGKFVLSGHGVAFEYLNTWQEGDNVSVSLDYAFQSDPSINSTIIRNAVSGLYDVVLQNNTVVKPDMSSVAPGDEALVMSSHPRTSVGYTANKDFVFFTVVEGRREGIAAGVSYEELGQVMKYLGAANAINLDGGGSSCLMIGKQTMNYCTDGSQRAVANGLAIIKK